ncbi:hypothetical protein EHW97_15115 [Aeromicrobium camelliae]|uniref:Histidine kinase/HSP90-like ATPase domain-containing protein n=2 Tax=Aeromicrobium TaxID=2040 RepID=A0A3N6WJ46_9ACTN|nr:ATP-binding protein [Aeromicrobium camelliae]RQN01658.1 hypothetical protein EHW97_15115 [Aeromicrobium camelliae]
MTSSRERIQRLLLASLGGASLIYTFLGLPQALEQIELMHPIGGWALYVLCAVLPPAAGLTAFSTPLRVPLGITTAACIAYALAMALWVPLMRVPALPDASVTWLQNVSAIAAAAAAIAWPVRGAWAYTIAFSAGIGLLRSATAPQEGPLVALQDGIFVLMLASIFVVLIQVSLTAGHRLDLADAQAREDAAHEAAARSTHEQRKRLGALVHDHVLSLLLTAARSDDHDRPMLRQAAMNATAALTAPDKAKDISGQELVARIRGSLPSEFRFESKTAAEMDVPADVATALLEAAAEAIRNSLLHAGPASRLVQTRLTAESISIKVKDDGRGFRPQRVPPERLGLRVSIHERMRTVPGGSATVRSTPGQGTTVELSWNRDAR